MKVLRIKKGETLSDYYKRLAEHYGGKPVKKDELYDVLRELSITSYAHGSNDAIQAIKNPLRRI